MHRHEDHECLSCGAHWLQNCSCSSEEIEEAEKKRDKFEASVKESKSYSLEELIAKLKGN